MFFAALRIIMCDYVIHTSCIILCGLLVNIIVIHMQYSGGYIRLFWMFCSLFEAILVNISLAESIDVGVLHIVYVYKNTPRTHKYREIDK